LELIEMKATIVDLRRNTSKILAALDRNETVTLTRRGKEIASIVPTPPEEKKKFSIRDHPAVGMWKDREDMKDPVECVREMRSGRYHDL
jgi:antitoxin (DNA-binding transcriptional repressor) of toxin-antitoxin stability system